MEVSSIGEEVVEVVLEVVSATGVEEVVVYQSLQVVSVELEAVVSSTGVLEVAVVLVVSRTGVAEVVVVVVLELVSATGVEVVEPPSTGVVPDQSPQVWVPFSRRKWNFSCLLASARAKEATTTVAVLKCIVVYELRVFWVLVKSSNSQGTGPLVINRSQSAKRMYAQSADGNCKRMTGKERLAGRSAKQDKNERRRKSVKGRKQCSSDGKRSSCSSARHLD